MSKYNPLTKLKSAFNLGGKLPAEQRKAAARAREAKDREVSKLKLENNSLKAAAAKTKIKAAASAVTSSASSVKRGLAKIGGVFSGIAKKTTAAAKKSSAKRTKATAKATRKTARATAKASAVAARAKKLGLTPVLPPGTWGPSSITTKAGLKRAKAAAKAAAKAKAAKAKAAKAKAAFTAANQIKGAKPGITKITLPQHPKGLWPTRKRPRPAGKITKPIKDPRGASTIFPSPHPKVKNAKGVESHVKLRTFGFDGREYVLPTMVGGTQLSDDEAIASAKKYGLSSYPSFSSLKEAETWIAANHGKITGSGKGRSIPQRGAPSVLKK